MGRERRSLGAIGLATVVAASLTWLSLLVAARSLGPARYSDFLVVWGLFFGVTGVLAGLQQEVTRAATADDDGPPRTALARGVVTIAVIGVIVILASAPVWAPGAFNRNWGWTALALAVCFGGYCVANLINGALASTRSWNEYASLIVAEGVVRAAAIVIVVGLGGRALGWGLAITAALLAWVVVGLGSQRVRTALRTTGDLTIRRFLRQSGQAMAASACSAAMITGFAPLLKATGPADFGAASGVVLAAVIVTRAPVLVLLIAFQGPIIATLVQGGADAARALFRWIVWGILATGFAAVVGAAAGPAVVRIIFGSSFSAGGRIIACAIVGAGLLALLTVIGWLALARGSHGALLLGWTAALAATAGTLSIDIGVDARAGLALVVGPLVGVVTIVLTLNVAPRWIGTKSVTPDGTRLVQPRQ